MISGFAGDVFRGEHPEKLTTYFDGAPTGYYDLWRVENGKIAEHWDVMETIADQSTWQNTTILCVLHKPYKSHYNQNIK